MDKIDELLTRGVDKIYPSREALEKILKSGKKLRLYLGVDPSGDKLHIGHAVALRKLRQFQEEGHHVILLIGDFTGMIGDPSGKTSERKRLTHDEVLQNAKTYKEQAAKILDFGEKNPIELKFNSHWLSKLTFEDVVKLAGNFTVQQMIERDMFQKRIKEKKPIGLHEFMYPLMQGYDSVAMGVDLEVGGTDQTFNMLAGRTLMDVLKHKEKFVLTVPLLTDNQGVKIGKTEGNVIAITAPPNDLYSMIMSLSDDVIDKCFEYITDVPMEEVERIRKNLKSGKNPMQYKEQLAYTLTKMLNDVHSAEEARMIWKSKHQYDPSKGDISWMSMTSLPTYAIPSNASIVSGTVSAGILSSNSEVKRLINQGAIERDGKVITENGPLIPGNYRYGKKIFVKFKK